MTAQEWSEEIQRRIGAQLGPIEARAFMGQRWKTHGYPARLYCDDGHEYVVKDRRRGKTIVNEQIVASVGRAMGGPIPEVAIVNVPTDLVRYQSELRDMLPGLAHGSRWITGCVDGWFEYQTPENRPRLAALALLFGWIPEGGDSFLIYEKEPPHLVHSVDHGHFFPGGPDWTHEALLAAPMPEWHRQICERCALSEPERLAAKDHLRRLTEFDIAEAVAKPPETWDVTSADRVAVAEYLDRRRLHLIQ